MVWKAGNFRDQGLGKGEVVRASHVVPTVTHLVLFPVGPILNVFIKL